MEEVKYLMLFIEIIIIIAIGYFSNYFIQRTLLAYQKNIQLSEAILIPVRGLIKWFIIVAIVLLICR